MIDWGDVRFLVLARGTCLAALVRLAAQAPPGDEQVVERAWRRVWQARCSSARCIGALAFASWRSPPGLPRPGRAGAVRW
jgi:hypothetical protein